MCQKIKYLLLIVLAAAATASASELTIISYEPAETNLVISSGEISTIQKLLGGVGGVLHDGAGNRMLLKALKTRLRADIPLREIDAHINDCVFVDACVDQLIAYMEEKKE